MKILPLSRFLEMAEGIRINKYLSEYGICSRREADRRLSDGEITINGRAAQPGDKVMPGDKVIFCGRPVEEKQEPILLLVHKPVGIVCTAEKREKDNIIDFLHYPSRVYPIGRLDKDSSGLILMTNQGDIVNRMMRSGNMHEKEYIVTVNRPVTEQFLKGLSEGVPLKELGVMTRKCKAQKLGSRQFRIILTQGYNRQIRRMCQYFDYRVTQLQRIRVMNFQLGDLKEGTYRRATEAEWRELMRLLKDSDNAPAGTYQQSLPRER